MNTRTHSAPETTPATSRDTDHGVAKGSDQIVRNRKGRRTTFERIVQTAWYRAEKRGFVPGCDREYTLESELRRMFGRGKSRDA